MQGYMGLRQNGLLLWMEAWAGETAVATSAYRGLGVRSSDCDWPWVALLGKTWADYDCH